MFTMLTAFALASALSGPIAAQGTFSAADDIGLLAVVVKQAASEPGVRRLYVDPRPLAPRSDIYLVHPDARQPVADSTVRLRVAAIRGAGFDTVDATVAGQGKGCPGVFVGWSADTMPRQDAHRGCPAANIHVLAVALPRQGTAHLASDIYDRDNCVAAVGYWAVRIVLTNLGPMGASVHASDVILRKRESTWEAVKTVGLMYVE